MTNWVVAALYKFQPLENLPEIQAPLKKFCLDNGIVGSLLLATEGINGTIAGSRQGIDAVIDYLQNIVGIHDLEWKESTASKQPFKHTKVRLKKEIVTLGVPGISPTKIVGTYVKPTDWNQLIQDPDVVVLDTRNDYEYAIGTFQRAINPNTTAFGQFPDFVKQNLDPAKHRKIAMFCTGGIRCEKASSYMLEQGFAEVYHLEGGILKYLEEVPQNQSLWDGACFVFDERISVTHGLAEGPHILCADCDFPIDKNQDCCPRCGATLSVAE